MKHRAAPDPVRFRPDPALDDSVRLKRALGELKFADRFGEVARLDALRNSNERLFANATYISRKFTIDREMFGKHLERATNATQKVVVQPLRDTPIDDCLSAWSQPEAQVLWERWWNPTIRKADRAAYEGSKVAMVALGGSGLGPHLRNVHEILRKCPDFLEHFAALATASSRCTTADIEASVEAALTLRGYSSVTRHFGKLAAGLPYVAMGTNVAVVRELANMFPDSQIGCFAAVDGDLVAAWSQQRSSWDKRSGGHNDDIERALRRRTPEAGFRAFTYTIDGPQDASPKGGRLKAISKSVRGYNLITLTELRTGIPLVWLMGDASALHEPQAVRQLLELLFQLWPDCPLKAISADKLWDEHGAHEFCAVHYGVALVTPRKESNRKHGGKNWANPSKGETEHPSLLRISGAGVAYCREHGQPLTFLGTEWPSRAGLPPGGPFGETATALHAKRFRSRWTGGGACSCGRLSAATSVSWSALPRFPHTPYGRPDLFAMRIALLASRNAAESTFSSVEIAFKQALASGVRTRLLDKDTVEALISIAYSTRALLLLADQRRWMSRSRMAA